MQIAISILGLMFSIYFLTTTMGLISSDWFYERNWISKILILLPPLNIVFLLRAHSTDEYNQNRIISQMSRQNDILTLFSINNRYRIKVGDRFIIPPIDSFIESVHYKTGQIVEIDSSSVRIMLDGMEGIYRTDLVNAKYLQFEQEKPKDIGVIKKFNFVDNE